MSISQVNFDLSLLDAKNSTDFEDVYLQAHTYEVTAADGSTLTNLSIGQLVMAICLKRATQLEEDIIELMNEQQNTTLQLEAMTEIEDTIVNALGEADSSAYVTIGGTGAKTITWNGTSMTYKAFLKDVVGMDGITDSTNYVRKTWQNSADISYDDFITNIESKMDSLNSFSQEKMIELQSQTSKRDQTYDLISNVLKSLNTTLTGIVNNT